MYSSLLILLRFIYPILGLRTDFSQRMNMKAQFSNDLFIYETIRASRVNSSRNILSTHQDNNRTWYRILGRVQRLSKLWGETMHSSCIFATIYGFYTGTILQNDLQYHSCGTVDSYLATLLYLAQIRQNWWPGLPTITILYR